MTRPLVEYLDAAEAAAHLGPRAAALGATEFACVRNLDYVFSPYEKYALAPRVRPPLPHIVAFAVDMDGTSTTTEPLALHALEYMVRRLTNRPERADWAGLDPRRDYPFVIGNSNFRHTEFLLERYGELVDRAALRQAFCEALLWTLANVDDAQRSRDITRNARNCGLADLLADAEFRRLVRSGDVGADNVGRLVEPAVRKYADAFHCPHQGALVSAALDVYYMRYHAILQRIARGEGETLSRELPGMGGRPLIEPMPGYTIFVALIKGWLAGETDGLCAPLCESLHIGSNSDAAIVDPATCRVRLARLATGFQRRPARLALVTASIAFEAQAVMKEVQRLMLQEMRAWQLSAARRDSLEANFADDYQVFDGFVNASDAHEARLKPHPDLYGIALSQMSIARSDYSYCVGLEDTEPGIVALRAAGVGCAVALPNRDTSRQNYTAAAQIVTGGLPELILVHNLLLQD